MPMPRWTKRRGTGPRTLPEGVHLARFPVRCLPWPRFGRMQPRKRCRTPAPQATETMPRYRLQAAARHGARQGRSGHYQISSRIPSTLACQGTTQGWTLLAHGSEDRLGDASVVRDHTPGQRPASRMAGARSGGRARWSDATPSRGPSERRPFLGQLASAPAAVRDGLRPGPTKRAQLHTGSGLNPSSRAGLACRAFGRGLRPRLPPQSHANRHPGPGRWVALLHGIRSAAVSGPSASCHGEAGITARELPALAFPVMAMRGAVWRGLHPRITLHRMPVRAFDPGLHRCRVCKLTAFQVSASQGMVGPLRGVHPGLVSAAPVKQKEVRPPCRQRRTVPRPRVWYRTTPAGIPGRCEPSPVPAHRHCHGITRRRPWAGLSAWPGGSTP